MGKHKEKIKGAQEGENATPVGTLDDLAGVIAGEAPEAQPGVMAAYAASEQNAEGGEAPAPQPEGDAPKKRGRPRKPDSELKEPRRVKVPKKDAPAADPGVTGSMVNAETASFVTGAKESILVALIGPEWQLSDTEKALENTFLTASLDRYAPDGMPVNPLAMYAVISASHAAKRFSVDNTKTFWQRTKTRLAAWWLNRKLKKEGRKNATYADRGSNHDGENNPGNATGPENQG